MFSTLCTLCEHRTALIRWWKAKLLLIYSCILMYKHRTLFPLRRIQLHFESTYFQSSDARKASVHVHDVLNLSWRCAKPEPSKLWAKLSPQGLRTYAKVGSRALRVMWGVNVQVFSVKKSLLKKKLAHKHDMEVGSHTKVWGEQMLSPNHVHGPHEE